METRLLGRTGHRSSIVTLGGAVFIYPVPLKEGDEYVKHALDAGVNHIDVAPNYGDAETRLGKWVREYRDDVYLGCKTKERTKEAAARSLEQSLKRLQTDYFDLYQFHGLDTPEDLATVAGPGGALEAFMEAKEEGLINNIGVTSHNPLNTLRAMDVMDLDTVLIPVSYVLHAHREPLNDYVPVLQKAQEKGVGVLAMKAVAKSPRETGPRRGIFYNPFTTPEEVEEALWYVLSQDVATVTLSSHIETARMMIDSAEHFKPLNGKAQEALEEKASDLTPLFPRAG